MLAALPSSRLPALLAFAALCFGPCVARADGAPDSLLEYRSTAQTHGLYEIREEAMRFLEREGDTHRAGWRALDPDIRIQVDRCAVPLKSVWVQKPVEFPYPTIEVSCAKTVDKRHPQWKVSVPVYQPKDKK
jgi:hypothetical protein